MISYHDFQSQALDKQMVLISKHGSCVMSIRYYGYKVNLYLLGNFYLEVFYNQKNDLVEKIIPLDVLHSRIKFYTDQIRLPKPL